MCFGKLGTPLHYRFRQKHTLTDCHIEYFRGLARGKDAVPELFARILEIIGDKGTLESKSKPDERTKSIIVAPAK